MKNNFTNLKSTFLLPALLIMYSGTMFGQWVSQTSPTKAKLESVYFVNSITGFTAGGFSSMYKTTDGGANWSLVGGYSATDIHFFNATNGYTSGVVGSGSMKKTTNGGTSWTTLTPPNSSSIWGTFATSASTVFYIATDNKVHKSINSGSSFTSITLSGSSYPTDIFFTDASNGFIVDQTGKIWRTINGGSSWSNIYTVTGCLLSAVYFVDGSTGFVCGSGGKIYKTTDGGSNWAPLSTGTTSAYFKSIRFYNANNGLAVGFSGLIMRTSNGGTTWTTETSNTTQHLFSVFYTSSNQAVVVGDSGVILKNNAVTSIKDVSDNKIISIYPNPFQEVATITISDNIKNVSLKMFDILGSAVKTENIDTNVYQINRRNLQSGIYFIQVLSDGHVIKTEKLVIE